MSFASRILSPVRRHEELPPDVYLTLVDSLYQDRQTLLVGTVFVAGSIFFTYWKTDEPLLLYFALAFVFIACLRGLSMYGYFRARAAGIDVDGARRWESRYVLGASASVLLLGLWCFVAFGWTQDPFAAFVSYAMTVAYGTGIFGRNFGNDRFVIVQLVCASIPMTAALVLYGDAYYRIFACFLAPSFLGIKFMADRLRRTLLDAVIASRDMSLLAKRFDTALNNMPHGLCMFDSERRVVVSNQKLNELAGLPADLELKGSSARQLVDTSSRRG